MSSTTGATVSASPNSSRVYTVTVTNANGCTATATASILVPNIGVTTSATPATACYNGSSQLQATTNSSYTLAAISPNLAPVPAGATLGQTGDDTYSAALPLPFNFNFFGTDYSQFYVTTNGYITFTDFAATTDF